MTTYFMLNNVKELKQRLTEVWSRQQHNIVNTDVRDCTKHLRACICTQGQHFEHLLQTVHCLVKLHFLWTKCADFMFE